MDGNSSDCCLLCGEQLDGNGDVASPNSCAHVFHLICIKNWADIKINAGHPVTCPLQSCLKSFQSIGVKKNSKTMKVVNVVPVDQDWSCPICLNSMSQVNEIGNPEVCNHHFCLKCLLEWSQTNTSCPLDRMEFRIIFVKNAVGGAIQRRVRTPQRDLRADLTDGESEDTEDDVEVTVANAVSNSLVVAASELMRNRMLSATCPQCQLTAGPDAVVCSACHNAYHRHCARVRDARVDQWRCLQCRSQNPPPAQRGRRPVAISPLTRVRRNAIVFNEWHGEFLQLIGNRNYHSSDDDTYSYDTERADADNASEDSVNSLTSESGLSVHSPPRNTEALLESHNHASSSDNDDDDFSRRRGGVSDEDESDEDSEDSEDVNHEPPQTRQAAGRRPPSRPSPPPPANPAPLRSDLFSQFSDSDGSGSSYNPTVPLFRIRERRRVSNTDTDSDSDFDERDGRRSRVSHHRSSRAISDSSHSSGLSEAVEATSSRSSDSSDEIAAARRPPRPHPAPSRRRARWESDESEEDEGRPPKQPRLAAERAASRSTAQTSRPRRQAAPLTLAESSFVESDEPRPSSTGRHRTARNQERPSSSSRGGGRSRSRGAASTASRRATDGSFTSPATSRLVAGSSSSSNAASRRATAGSSSSRRGGASSSGGAARSSRGRRAANSGSARTSGKRKTKKSTARKKATSKKRKSSVKKHKVVRKARKRQKRARRENRQASIVINPQLPNRSESTEGAPRLSLLGEGRFPSGPYDTMLYTPASPEETTVSSTQGHSSQTSDPPPAPSSSGVSSSSSSGFLSGLLANQSRLFTPTKYLRVNASDGSLFAVSREEMTADILIPGARRTSSPPTSESPPSANELQASTSSSSSSPADQESPPAASSAVLASEEVEEPVAFTYSPVEESAPGASDMEVDSTPLTDISSSTLGGRIYAARSSQAEQSAASSPERPSAAAGREELKRAQFATRRDFETAVANIAKRTVGNYYLSRVLSKEEYKAQLKRIVQKVSGSGHSVHKVKNIIHLAEKCVESFIKSRPHPSHVKKS